ncbi:MAG: hypothetical protein WBL55_22940, partial [Xanthobacteraceae bacterium]
ATPFSTSKRLGLGAAADVRKMEHREPISKSEYLAVNGTHAAAIGILAIIAVLLFAMPQSSPALS